MNQTANSAQFTTRQMLILFVALSVVFAILGTILRNLPVQHWWGVMAYVSGVTVVGLVLLALAMRRRALAEIKAGPSRLVVKGALSSWYHIGGITTTLVTLLVISGGLIKVAMPDGEYPALSNFIGLITWSPFLMLTSGSYFVCMVWWKVGPWALDIRENGVIIGAFYFTEWKYLRGFKWNKFSNKLMLLTDSGFIEHVIPKHAREDVAEALREFLAEQ